MGVLGNEPEVAGSFILFYVATEIRQNIFIIFLALFIVVKWK